MGTLTFPFTLTAGQPENVNQLNSNLAAVQSVLNGSVDVDNLDDGAVTFAKLAAAVQALLVPPGTILATGRSSAATGYLLCDGSSVLRATYPDLFTAIGTTFGSADGTHFTLPDAMGRSLLGAGSGSGLTARTLSTKLGTEPVNMPTHTHSLTSGGSVLSDAGGTFTANGTDVIAIKTNSIANATNPGGDNMQPNLVVNYMIKT